MKKSFVLIVTVVVLTTLSDNTQSSNNTYAETNPLLVGKRHGSVNYQNANSSSGISKPAVEQNPFLRQKRHQ